MLSKLLLNDFVLLWVVYSKYGNKTNHIIQTVLIDRSTKEPVVVLAFTNIYVILLVNGKVHNHSLVISHTTYYLLK